MSRCVMLSLKVAVHLLCLAPLVWLVHFCTSASLFHNADPVKFITHFTGDWAIYILLASTAMSLFGSIGTGASWLLQFHRLPGLYAFFYATLHLAIYSFVYSGYDLIGAFTDFRIGQLGTVVEKWNAVSPLVFEDLRKRPFIDVGLFGWVIMLLATAISQGFIRRALGGKKWQHLHRLIYAATAAALIHLSWFAKATAPAAEGSCIDTSRKAAVSTFPVKRAAVPTSNLDRSLQR